MNSNTYVGSKLARTPHPCVYSDVISLALLVSMGDTAPPEGDSQLDRHEAFEEPRHARNRVGKELLPLQQNIVPPSGGVASVLISNVSFSLELCFSLLLCEAYTVTRISYGLRGHLGATVLFHMPIEAFGSR